MTRTLTSDESSFNPMVTLKCLVPFSLNMAACSSFWSASSCQLSWGQGDRETYGQQLYIQLYWFFFSAFKTFGKFMK